MKTRWCFIAVFVVLAAFPCISRAHAETAEEMLSACRPIVEARVSDEKVYLSQTFDAGSCWGAFAALQQIFFLYDGNDKPALDACVPSNTNRTELIAIFVKYVESHPKVYPENFAVVAVNATIASFPCKSTP